MIQTLAPIAKNYDHFIIDIFGVLHDGIRPFPETVATLTKLKKAGKQTCLLSNSPRRTDRVIEHMAEIGIPRSLYDHIATSGEATHEYLNTPQWQGKTCWFIGKNFKSDLNDLDLHFTDGPDDADFILNSIPGTSSTEVETLKRQLDIAQKRGISMICANPDLVVNIGNEQFECAGTFAALYEQMGGTVIYQGKPHSEIYETCYTLLGRPDKSRIAAIGDSLHTDIAGANRFGIAGIWNLEGIHGEEVQIKGMNTILKAHPHKPDYVMKGFVW